MRDWVGGGISIAGVVVMAVALTLWVRSRAWRPARQSGTAWRRSSVATFAALLLLQGGQVIRPHAWPLTILYAAATAIAVAGLLLVYRTRPRS